jgi:enamine deaminase RidA (YjgF/YER057c/UK114 family)
MERTRFSNNTEFERLYGYCRAVRVGSQIFVSGTTALEEDLSGDTHAQFMSAVKRIEAALRGLNASLSDVVRTVVYITDMADVQAITKAHSAMFGAHPPASTLIQVSALTPPEARVEIEVTAVLGV